MHKRSVLVKFRFQNYESMASMLILVSRVLSSAIALVSKLGASLGSRNLRHSLSENASSSICVPFLCESIPDYFQFKVPHGIVFADLWTSWPKVGLAEGTFYPAVHTVLGGWYTKEGLLNNRGIVFIGSIF